MCRTSIRHWHSIKISTVPSLLVTPPRRSKSHHHKLHASPSASTRSCDKAAQNASSHACHERPSWCAWKHPQPSQRRAPRPSSPLWLWSRRGTLLRATVSTVPVHKSAKRRFQDVGGGARVVAPTPQDSHQHPRTAHASCCVRPSSWLLRRGDASRADPSDRLGRLVRSTLMDCLVSWGPW